MPEFQMPKGDRPRSFDAIAPFARGYIEAVFFTNCDRGDELDGATWDDVAPETVARIMTDCDRFERENAVLLQAARTRCDMSDEQLGRDFWFTRCGAGVGYWDRKELERDNIGASLTEACRAWPSLDLYRGDDRRLYLA